VSDIDAVTGLVSPCLLCGVVPSIDYLVDDGYWQDTVPSHLRAGVICLPCLVERAGTVAFEHVRLIYLTVGGTTRAFGGAGARIEALEKALTQASAALASARQTLSNLAHGDLTGDQKQIALNAAANAAHAVVVAEAALRGEEER